MSFPARSVSAVALGFSFWPAPAPAQGVSIEHQGVGCVLAGKYPRLDARLDPADAVARARLNFRPEGGAHWYFVEMKPGAGLFHGVLPKPLKALHRFSYYIDVTDKAFHASRTAEFVSDVASGPAACGREKVLAASLTRANVLLHAPEGVAGAPAVPAGFASEGVVAAGGAAGATAATAGGLGAKAIILGTVLAAGGTAAVIATTSGGDSGSAGTVTPPPTTVPAGPPPTTLAASPPPPAASLTGTWVGNRPTDGIVLTFDGCGFCPNVPLMDEADLFMALDPQGSGNGTMTIRAAQTPGCPAEPNCKNLGPIGDVWPSSVSSALSGTSVTMQWTVTVPGPNGGTFSLNFTGVLSGNRMSGAVTLTALIFPNGVPGTWSMVLQ